MSTVRYLLRDKMSSSFLIFGLLFLLPHWGKISKNIQQKINYINKVYGEQKCGSVHSIVICSKGPRKLIFFFFFKKLGILFFNVLPQSDFAFLLRCYLVLKISNVLMIFYWWVMGEAYLSDSITHTSISSKITHSWIEPSVWARFILL